MISMKNLENDKAFQRDALLDLNRMLDEELAKPPKKRDYQKIEEISRSCAAIMGDEEQEEQLIGQGYEKLISSVQKRPIRVARRFKLLMSAGIAAVVLLAANAISVAAFHQDVFSVIIHYTENSFSVETTDKTKVELPTTPDDPYGIKAEAARYGLVVEAPTYLPEGFVLWQVEEHESSAAKQIRFLFQKDEVHLAFSYAELYDMNAKAGIPSDHFNLEEIEVNGKPAITSKEDKQYSLIYYDGTMEYLMFSDCLAYEECDKIVSSIQ